jgi:hypothetical protein
MNKSRADQVLEKIKREKIAVKSRINVVLSRLGYDGLLLSLFSVLALIAGVILVWLIGNRDLLSDYGANGWLSFLQSFPYLPAGIFALLFLVFIFGFRRFDFSYKKPLVIISGFLLVLVIGIAWLLSINPVGKNLFTRGGQMMQVGKSQGANFVSGTVVEVGSDYLTLEYDNGQKETVYLSDTTHYRFGEPEEGDFVRSVGKWNEGKFEAVGVRVFSEENPPGEGPGHRRRLNSNPEAAITPAATISPDPSATPSSGTQDSPDTGQKRIQNR